MDESQLITPSRIARAHDAFVADRANIVAKNAVSAADVRQAARAPEAAALATTVFDVQLEQGDVTNQLRSGRCWMFASLNTMRFRVMKKLGLKTFELSQAYPLFWDKYERANWFFENIIATAREPLASREVAYLLDAPMGDGGQWDMFRAIVKKYGVVPKEAMPETYASSHTAHMNGYLTRWLRAGAKQLRELLAQGGTAEDAEAKKTELLEGVYRILAICLGEPPKTFEVRIRNDKNELKAQGTYTPQAFFAEFVGMELDDYVSLISAPTSDKPFMRSYTVKFLGNVREAGGVRYANLPIASLKRAAVAQLKDELPVWFGCDVGQASLGADGIMDQAAVATDELFGLPIEAGLDRAARLDYGESLMTHAMTFQGVNLDDAGNPTRWRVENSWGDDRGKKGYDIMSDAWFDEYVYQVVVDKKYLTDDERAVLDTEPVELAPWDPMGSLAR